MKYLITFFTILFFSPLYTASANNDLSSHQQNRLLCRQHQTALEKGSNRAQSLATQLKDLQKSGEVKAVMHTWRDIENRPSGVVLTTQHMAPSFLAVYSKEK